MQSNVDKQRQQQIVKITVGLAVVGVAAFTIWYLRSNRQRSRGKDRTNLIAKQRGAILGAVVGDAAALPLHWLYKDDELQSKIVDKDNKKLIDFAFLPQCQCPFYRIPSGSNSCYGDEFMLTLRVFSENDNKFDIEAYKAEIAKTYGGEENAYQVAKKQREKGYPVQGPWINGTIIDFLTKYENKQQNTGGDHDDNDGLMGALSYTIIRAALRDESDEMKAGEFPQREIEQVIKVLIEPQVVVDRGVFVCRLLWQILTGDDEDDLITVIYKLNEMHNKSGNKTVYDEVNAVLDDCNVVRSDGAVYIDTRKKGKYAGGLKEAVASKAYGKSCALPGNFKSVLFSLIVHSAEPDYRVSMLEEIEAGGDNCSRALIDGCIMGALLGESAIPQQWIQKADNVSRMNKCWSTILYNKIKDE